MNILYVIFLSIFSLFVLFFLTKLMGYRQLSEMSMFDYVTGITIGSIAAEMSTSPDKKFLEPFTAMIVYGLATFLLAILTGKSMKIRRFISGSPYVLLNHGKLYEKNLKKGHIDLSEFLVQCRLGGYFDLSELETVILEENGKFSFLPKSSERPVTPSDLQMDPEPESLLPTYIMDGHILKENLHHAGKNEIWLKKQLAAHGCTDIQNILLATGNRNHSINLFLKNHLKGSAVIKE